jgi:hypothetical protein
LRFSDPTRTKNRHTPISFRLGAGAVDFHWDVGVDARRGPGRFTRRRPDDAATSPRFLGLARELVLQRRRPAVFFGIPERLIRQGGRSDTLSTATLTIQGVVINEVRYPPDYIFLQHGLKIFSPDYLLAGSAGEPFSG